MSIIISENCIEKTVTIKNGKEVVRSDNLAKMFDKQHKTILRQIRGLMCDLSNTNSKLIDCFREETYVDLRGKEYPRFEMSIDGAICLIEHFRANTPKRKEVLVYMYELKGEIVITQGTERREKEFVRELGFILDNFKIKYILQYPIKRYRIDLYIPAHNIAVEYDEEHHNFKKDKKRENNIKDAISCKFIRVSDELELGQGLGIVLGKILQEIK